MAKKIECYVCGKENLAFNEIGLNKKLIGKDTEKFHCLQCLADYLDITDDELKERIQGYKDAGCVLFE